MRKTILNNKILFLLIMVLLIACNRKYSPSQLKLNRLSGISMKESLSRSMDWNYNHWHDHYFKKSGKSIYFSTIEQKDSFVAIHPKQQIYVFNYSKGWQLNGEYLEIDSLYVMKYMLRNMPVGGRTWWSSPYFYGEPAGGDDTYLPPLHRRDLIMYYYLYYGFFGAEREFEGVHYIILQDSLNNEYSCSPLDTMFTGDPYKLYEKLPPSKDNEMLFHLHQCYKSWVARIEKVGWNEAQKMGLSPFDNCLCKIVLFPPKD
ncbi:MAG: hypothetical protein GY810_23330 [Aureispira sp.]|nr:hypothetical protein [Aureispira sp.]